MARSELGHRRSCRSGEGLESSACRNGVVLSPEALEHEWVRLCCQPGAVGGVDLLLCRCQAGWEGLWFAHGSRLLGCLVGFFVFWYSYVRRAPHKSDISCTGDGG